MKKPKEKYELGRALAASSGRLVSITAVVFAFALALPVLLAQSATFPVDLPARAPGYEHYYQTEQPSTAFATRWGYFDGYEDGKHNSELGDTSAPADHDRYKLAPDHGFHPEMTREKYKIIYREAYLHGYDYGSKF